MAWWDRFVGWLRGLWRPTPPPALTAREAMEELRRGKEQPADPEQFRQLRNRLAVLVLSSSDRARLWRRSRGREPGEVRPLDAIHDPGERDLRALRALVSELEHGR